MLFQEIKARSDDPCYGWMDGPLALFSKQYSSLKESLEGLDPRLKFLLLSTTNIAFLSRICGSVLQFFAVSSAKIGYSQILLVPTGHALSKMGSNLTATCLEASSQGTS